MKTILIVLLALVTLIGAIALVYRYGLNWKTALPIILSVFSLAVSFFNLWVSRLSPFDLHVGIGNRIYLTWDNTLDRLIKVPLILANPGASGGMVSDVAIEIKKKADAGAPFVGNCKFQDTKNEVYMGNPATPPQPSYSLFNGAFLNPGDAKSMLLCFVIYKDPNTNQGSFEYEVGDYTISVLTRLVNSTEWVRQGSTEFSIDELDRQALQVSKTATGFTVVLERILMTSHQTDRLKTLIKRKAPETVEAAGR